MSKRWALTVLVFLLASALPTHADVKVLSSHPGGIHGRVTITKGKPAQYELLVFGTQNDDDGLVTHSDADGWYSFVGIKPGEYVVRAKLSLFYSVNPAVIVKKDTTSEVDIDLSGSVTASGRQLQMRLLGDRAFFIMGETDRVQAFRVGNALYPTTGLSFPRIDGYYLTATAKENGPAVAQQIRRILLDEATYRTYHLMCFFRPGVIFRLWRGSQSLDVILCFHCGEMYTVTRDAKGRGTYGVYTVLGGSSRSKFASLAKEAFPNDLDIQEL